uniref:Torsin-1A C-terminal domain-containing protein n=1 Tax=Acrobeloides nanus TaxID=290746 RepID=A0A914C4K7_9BILA
MDAIKPFIDFYEQIDNVDARKSVFLFLSNAGGHEIAKKTLEYYEEGRPREEITFKEMEEITIKSAYNEGKGGLKTSELITNHLIDYFVPFLPLERRHVILCIKDYLKQNGQDLTSQRIEAIADSIEYFPRANPVFSSSGCKKVAQKTELYLMTEQIEEEERTKKLSHTDEL